MRSIPTERGTVAFSLIELLVTIGVLILMAMLLLPRSGHGDKSSPQQWACLGNLKQIGSAVRTWGIDHGGKFPPQGEIMLGGSSEYIFTGETFRHFQVLSNALDAPKVLICPADVRKPALDFGIGLSNVHVSYFVGVDAAETYPNMFLAGDRNLTNGTVSLNRILEVYTNSMVRWTQQIHKDRGNIGMADGSVQSLSDNRLREAIQWCGTTNRLAMP